MSKREEMKKLREMRMKQLAETDRSTPAEEAAENAENALKKPKEEPLLVQQPTSAVPANPSKRLDFTYSAKSAKCGLTHTTIMLTDECMSLLTTRSAQMGMSQQDYFNMLIEEDRTTVDNSDELTPEHTIMGKIDLHGKKSKNITVTVDNFHFMKKAAAMRGISQTSYANYLLLKEHLREEKYGKRPGRYD